MKENLSCSSFTLAATVGHSGKDYGFKDFCTGSGKI